MRNRHKLAARVQRLRRNNSRIANHLARCRGRFPPDPRRVTPQVFQAVKRALVAMEDVDNNFEIVEHDPLARRKTVDRAGAQFMIVSQSGLNLTRDRLQLRLRRCRANDEEIGEAGDPGEIEHNDFFGLFVRSKLGAGRG
jgi:hypothetical protein